MEVIISTDAFEAFRTEEGIIIHEKKKAAKKAGLIVAGLGLAFIGISFINLEGLTAKVITDIFYGVFFYGGIVLVVLGVAVSLLRGMLSNPEPTEIIAGKSCVKLRGKSIPFEDMDKVTLQTTQMMNKQMTAILFQHHGRRKALVSGAILTSDLPALELFVDEVNALIDGNR